MTNKKLMLTVVALWLSAGIPLYPRTESPQASQSQNADKDSEAAKAAERRRRFEEEKQHIQNQEPAHTAQTSPCTPGKPTLYITPTEAAMLVGESRSFSLFDTDGHKLTESAQWSVSDYERAEIKQDREPTVTPLRQGTFKVIARIDTRSAEAVVKVYPGNKLPDGTAVWSVAPIPCKGNVATGIVQAVPH